MSLYPSLEDMKVDHIVQTQERLLASAAHAATHGLPSASAASAAYPSTTVTVTQLPNVALYPSLVEYMGLDMSEAALRQHMPVAYQAHQVAIRDGPANRQIAPITGDSAGLRRAEIRQGIRMVTLCKDGEGKMGLKVKAVNKGVFVVFVSKNSPAALAGLRFGDQFIEIGGVCVAGFETDKVMNLLKKMPVNGIELAVRDRPFERTVTMQRDSSGSLGFGFGDGKISHIVKDSSAARNGLLTEHQLIEVNGQCVVGMKDKELQALVRDGQERTVTITVMPSYVYEHMVKCLGDGLFKKFDHSIPDL